jgi:hypothetical protein
MAELLDHDPLLPKDQAFQVNRHTLRTNTQGIHVHALNHQRIHLDTLNVNAV